MKRIFVILPLAVLAVIVVFSLMQLTSKTPVRQGFDSPARPAPTIAMPDLDTQANFSLADYRGRPVLVNFWGSYCAPCRIEHPALMELQRQGVEIVGILYRDPDIEEARAILARNGNPYRRQGVDDEGRVFVEFGAAGVPETFLVSAEGQIVKSLRGAFDMQQNPEVLQQFLDAWRAEVAKAGPAPQPAASSSP
jgi:cytochrome c biogenesis protein CcmG/thiol:disulfide interchange protein DsbE